MNVHSTTSLTVNPFPVMPLDLQEEEWGWENLPPKPAKDEVENEQSATVECPHCGKTLTVDVTIRH